MPDHQPVMTSEPGSRAEWFSLGDPCPTVAVRSNDPATDEQLLAEADELTPVRRECDGGAPSDCSGLKPADPASPAYIAFQRSRRAPGPAVDATPRPWATSFLFAVRAGRHPGQLIRSYWSG